MYTKPGVLRYKKIVEWMAYLLLQFCFVKNSIVFGFLISVKERLKVSLTSFAS